MPLALPPFRRRLGASLALGVAGWLVLAPAAGVAHAEPTVVPLGVAKEFSVLAGSTITNTGPSTVNRSIGLFPGTDITGAGSLVVGGTTHAGDQRARTAKSDLTTAYNNAAGQTPRIAADSELAGETLVGGIYRRPAAMALNGALTLDGQNDPDSVWVFQAGSTLTAGSGSSIVLVRGADACNVFWQVGSSATIGTTTRFVGTIMADQSITMQTGARLRGRALARIGAVTLDTNVITSPQCDDDDTDGGGDGGTDGGGGDGGSDGGGDGGGDGGDNGGGDGGTDSGGDNGGDGGSGGGAETTAETTVATAAPMAAARTTAETAAETAVAETVAARSPTRRPVASPRARPLTSPADSRRPSCSRPPSRARSHWPGRPSSGVAGPGDSAPTGTPSVGLRRGSTGGGSHGRGRDGDDVPHRDGSDVGGGTGRAHVGADVVGRDVDDGRGRVASRTEATRLRGEG